MVGLQIRHRSSETIVLSLQLVESLHLIALQGTVLVSSSIVRDFRHAYRSDRVCGLPALCHQHINLPKLRTISSVVCLFLAIDLSSIRKSYFRENHLMIHVSYDFDTATLFGISTPHLSYLTRFE
jgi:hypothetical protein